MSGWLVGWLVGGGAGSSTDSVTRYDVTLRISRHLITAKVASPMAPGKTISSSGLLGLAKLGLLVWFTKCYLA